MSLHSTCCEADAQTNTPPQFKERSGLETPLQGSPVLFDLTGKKLADGNFTQTVENGRVQAVITFEFGQKHRIEEKAVFRQELTLVQEQWSWYEWRDDRVQRHFQVDFTTGKALAEKHEGIALKEWRERLKIEPGRTFAGFGFVLAIKSLRERLIKGGKIELEAVAFSPTPRIVPVDISYAGLDQMKMGGEIMKGDCFILHPKIPLIARPFVDVRDTRIWLTLPHEPVAFLRWEGSMVEPDDPMIRVDRLPGKESGAAERIHR